MQAADEDKEKRVHQSNGSGGGRTEREREQLLAPSTRSTCMHAVFAQSPSCQCDPLTDLKKEKDRLPAYLLIHSGSSIYIDLPRFLHCFFLSSSSHGLHEHERSFLSTHLSIEKWMKCPSNYKHTSVLPFLPASHVSEWLWMQVSERPPVGSSVLNSSRQTGRLSE
mmetsp:Transcript_30998/g.61129  ORF Transcript_30998/g.61129 Transcript_30998/m.61129 type:complete len:166 (-) Transcript_30998:188-685(-)